MSTSNRVVEAIRKIALLRHESGDAESKIQSEVRRRDSANRGITETTRQVEWGVGSNVRQRAIQVDGQVWVINWVADQNVTVELLAVENVA
jgi:hypothetical protein